MKTVAIILAGGSGERFGIKKQFIPIWGKPLLAHIVDKFEGLTKVITVPKSAMFKSLLVAKDNDLKDCDFIIGGRTRQESAFFALQHVQKVYKPDNVIITDANRALITRKNIDKGLALLSDYDCVVTVCKTTNTVCTFSAEQEYVVWPRGNMYDLLMPQFFKFDVIYKAHSNTRLVDATDDSQLVDQKSLAMIEIPFWEGLKLTYPEDFKVFKVLLKEEKE